MAESKKFAVTAGTLLVPLCVQAQGASSNSWDSRHELVEFTPRNAGAYAFKVRGFSCPSDFSYFGLGVFMCVVVLGSE